MFTVYPVRDSWGKDIKSGTVEGLAVGSRVLQLAQRYTYYLRNIDLIDARSAIHCVNQNAHSVSV